MYGIHNAQKLFADRYWQIVGNGDYTWLLRLYSSNYTAAYYFLMIRHCYSKHDEIGSAWISGEHGALSWNDLTTNFCVALLLRLPLHAAGSRCSALRNCLMQSKSHAYTQSAEGYMQPIAQEEVDIRPLLPFWLLRGFCVHSLDDHCRRKGYYLRIYTIRWYCPIHWTEVGILRCL